MKKAHILVALTLGCVGLATGAASARTLEIVEGAHEVDLAEVNLPTSPVGTLFFRLCADCKPQGLPVTPQTTYTIEGKPFQLRKFLEAIDDLHDRGGYATAMATIFYDMETNRVTRIAVSE